MRIWGKLIKDAKILQDRVVTDDSDDTRTHKVLLALEELCHGWDIAIPIWLESNIRDFQKTKKSRFTQDSFIEHIDFDFLEFQIIEE